MATSQTKPSTTRLSEAARHFVIPAGIVESGWPRVQRRLSEMGIRFDPWQEGLARVVLGKRADGKYAATVGGVTMSLPRQIGKTFMVGSLLVALCIEFPGLKVVWTAHRTRTATNTFRSLQGLCRRKKVAPHIDHIRTANGEQEIGFRNGSVIMFGAREQGFGRGFDVVDVEVFDEAQILTDKALDDMVAATNQAQHPHGALLFFMGTPPRPIDPSEAFAAKRAEALSGSAEQMVYVEFSADDDAGLDDPKQWAKANPSYPSRTPHESMLRLRKNLPSDVSWQREALGVWDSETTHQIVKPSDWHALAVPAAGVPLAKPGAFAVSATEERLFYVGVGVPGERDHVELGTALPMVDSRAVVDWLAERAGRKKPIVIDTLNPAASLAEELKNRRCNVVLTGATGMARACGGFFDAIREGRLSHFDQEPVNLALAGATKRNIGTAGGWGYARSGIEFDVQPLEAVTLAHYGLTLSRKTGHTGRNYESTRNGEVS